MLAHHVARPSLARRLGEGVALNTDDRNRVEFGFAKNLGNFARVDTLFDEARAHGEERPILVNDDSDPLVVTEERMMQLAAEGIDDGAQRQRHSGCGPPLSGRRCSAP